MNETSPHDRVLCIEDIAAICHETNRAYCQTLGDTSQVPWPDAPQWQRDSACNGVRFQLANPDAPASASHVSWMAEKLEAGWEYGETKDAEAKTHPCMVPFDKLPKAQQLKDHAFKALVKLFGPYIAWNPHGPQERKDEVRATEEAAPRPIR